MMTWVSNSFSRVSSPMSSLAAFWAAGLSSMALPWRFPSGVPDNLRGVPIVGRYQAGGAILSTGLVRGNGAMRPALAVQEIEPGTDHDGGTCQSPSIWDITKDQEAEGRGPNELGVH